MAQDKSLQEGIAEAGSPIQLLWAQDAGHITVPVVPPEYTGWAEEQYAWQSGVVLFNLCHHMSNFYVEGPDALKLISSVCTNKFDNFVVGQAKQIIAVTEAGHLINDGILMREGEEQFLLNAVDPLNNWIAYHAGESGLDVTCRMIENSDGRPPDVPPPYFRYQIQGPKAIEVVERLLGGPAPDVKFFHSANVTIAGCTARAFRHTMSGLPGYEFIGDWSDHDAVLEAMLAAGEPSGMVQVGGLAYYTNALESGWLPLLVPGIYDSPELENYRKSIPLNSFEGRRPLHGSYYSPDISDYYVSPYDMGYGKLVNFDHEFIGKAALQEARKKPHREKVTLVFNQDDVAQIIGEDPGYMRRDAQDRVEVDGAMIGLSLYTVNFPAHGTILSLALVDSEHAKPGTEVSVAWGDLPVGADSDEAHRGLPRIRATVAPSPYNDFARTQYRK